jgi:hypothetical protein
VLAAALAAAPPIGRPTTVCYHRQMLRPLPLWPTLLGVNLWLVALLVPLVLARGAASGVLWAAAPLAPLLLLASLWLRPHRLAQGALVVGVPLLVLLPSAEGSLASAKLHPPAAVAVQLAVLLAYLGAVCGELTRSGTALPATRPGDPAGTARAEEEVPRDQWQQQPRVSAVVPPRVRRRITVYRLLLGMSVAVPLLLLYAINWHPENVRALRAALGSGPRGAAMQAALTAAATMVWSVVFHFCFMNPMDAHLDHDRGLRSRLTAIRHAARRGRPRVNLYIAIGVALLSMGLLLWWSL